MIETRAPGKLFVAGEYAVVDPGEPAVLVAVDRCITVRLSEAARGEHESHLPEPPSEHVWQAMLAVEQLREERGLPRRGYDLDISTELEDRAGRKFGLGSSGAVTVAVIDALNRFYGFELTPSERYRLAMIATVEISPKASGGDLAASTFGGWLRYTSPDREQLRADRTEYGVSAALESDAWAACTVTALPAPAEARLLVGWTGTPASTEQLVDAVQAGDATAAISSAAAATERQRFLAASRDCVDRLVAALHAGGAAAPQVLGDARRVLQGLAATSGTLIETPPLTTLCDIAERHGAGAKPSGAGGGDCGIVLAGAHGDTAAILEEWRHNGILALDLAVYPAEGPNDEQ